MPVQTRKHHRYHYNRHHHHQGEGVQEMGDANGFGRVAETPRIDKLEFDENDEKIISATLKAFESGSLTPLIKEELRCTIQSRRIAEGKGEMKVEFKTPARKKEMNDDERSRALKRRQQNREAAQRFRQKQKDTSDYLSAKIRKLEKSSKLLLNDMNRLKEEKELLGQMLKDHLTVCSNPLITNHSFVFNNNSTSNDDIIQTPSSQSLLSTSSAASHFTFDATPNTAASDTSVFFSDDNNSIISPSGSDAQHSTHDAQIFSLNIDDLEKSYNTSENFIVYDSPLDTCYEEIIIDFADADSLHTDTRTRGDSCSSVDTVSSFQGSYASDLMSLSESTHDLRHSISSAYSQIQTVSCPSGLFHPNSNPMTDDLFLIDEGIAI